MKKTNNESYNRIMKFLSEEEVSAERRRYLIHYATKLYKQNLENVEKENIKDIFNDFNTLNNTIKICNDTSINKKRISEMFEILEKINSYLENPKLEIIVEISDKLDKLYLDSDMPLRKNSSLSYNLCLSKRKGR